MQTLRAPVPSGLFAPGAAQQRRVVRRAAQVRESMLQSVARLSRAAGGARAPRIWRSWERSPRTAQRAAPLGQQSSLADIIARAAPRALGHVAARRKQGRASARAARRAPRATGGRLQARPAAACRRRRLAGRDRARAAFRQQQQRQRRSWRGRGDLHRLRQGRHRAAVGFPRGGGEGLPAATRAAPCLTAAVVGQMQPQRPCMSSRLLCSLQAAPAAF
jgi:hypothetical protein